MRCSSTSLHSDGSTSISLVTISGMHTLPSARMGSDHCEASKHLSQARSFYGVTPSRDRHPTHQSVPLEGTIST